MRELHIFMAEDTDRLSAAAARGDLQETETLLQSNMKVNDRNQYGRTALQVVKLGCPSVAKALLQARADPNVRDPVGGLTVSHDAARDGHLDTLQVLVQNGADVNLLDNDGNLPLHLAAREGHLEVVQYLVSHCSSRPFQPNADGHAPHELASAHKQRRTAAWLRGLCLCGEK